MGLGVAHMEDRAIFQKRGTHRQQDMGMENRRAACITHHHHKDDRDQNSDWRAKIREMETAENCKERQETPS
jgi:hypothetical protein